MSVRDAPILAERRVRLLKRLGGKCRKCGSRSDLEFDHTHGRDWHPRRVSSWTRMRRYEVEAAKGLIQILCGTCNAAKAKADKEFYRHCGVDRMQPDPDAVPDWVLEEATA